MDLNRITFSLFFFSFFLQFDYNPTQKSTIIIINNHFKQLKSTKCFKYIKCSISDSLEKMLARLDREAVCNNCSLPCTKLMKFLLMTESVPTVAIMH